MTAPGDLHAWSLLGTALREFQETGVDHTLRVECSAVEPWDMPVEHFFRSASELPPVERTALRLCEGHVLDAGAGSGTHALALEALGHEVTAIDILPDAVEVMRVRGLRDPRVGDIFTFDGGPYDSVLMLMNGIGIVGDLDGLDRIFRALRRLVVPGGQVLFDSTDLAERGGRRGRRGRYGGEVTFTLTYRGKTGPTFPWLFVDSDTLGDAALDNGWSGEVVYQEPDGHYLCRLVAPR
ncbi:MAG: class I SAM-dependent methyltransferase [Pseudomonadota bacterium]